MRRLLPRPFGAAFDFRNTDLHKFQRGIDSELALIHQRLHGRSA